MQALNTVIELIDYHASTRPEKKVYFVQRQAEENGWLGFSWSEFRVLVRQYAHYLSRQGLKPGGRVGIMAAPSIEWEIANFAALSIGGVVVGIDPNESAENFSHIVSTSQLDGLISGDEVKLDRFPQSTIDALHFSIEIPQALTPPSGNHEISDEQSLESTSDDFTAPAADDIATIIFTSGSTGKPKPIAYRHDQLLLACRSILAAYSDIDSEYRFVCWLPLSNLFQRIVNVCAMYAGASIFIIEDRKTLMAALPSASPTVFIGVPRLFEKLYEGFDAKLKESSSLARSVVIVIFGVTDFLAKRLPQALPFVYPLCQPLFAQFRALFGDRLRYCISGSAPMPQWLLLKLRAMGILVLEAYGVSENIIPIAANRPHDFRFGSVGRPLPHNEVTLANDGEVLVRSPGVFSGYLDAKGDDEKDARGFLPTEDMGRFDNDGFLYLTGRKSEIFKTSTGHRISPTEIESVLHSTPGVDHAFIVGASRKHLITLLTTSGEELRAGPQRENLAHRICAALEDLPPHKRPAAAIVLKQGFSAETGELTLNMKVRRRVVEEKYRDEIEFLYRQLETTGDIASRTPASVRAMIKL